MNLLKVLAASSLLLATLGCSHAEPPQIVFFENYDLILGGLHGSVQIVHNTAGEKVDLSLRVSFPMELRGVKTPPLYYQDFEISLTDAAGKSVTLQAKDGAGDRYVPSVAGSSFVTGTYVIPEGWPLPDSKLVLDWVSKPATETVMLGQTYDDKVTTKVGEILQAATAIKPGQTRRDLQKEFTTEGGISIETQRRYVSRVCPIIKIDVEFKPASGEDESLDDVIVSVSKPFVESSISD